MKKKLLVSVMNLTVLIAVIGPSVSFPGIADEADVIIRKMTATEKAHFEKELQTCLDKVRLLAKTLDKYVDEIERLLKQAKQ